MAYECNNSEFIYFNKDGKTVASGYKIDCKKLNDRKPLMSTNITSDLTNMGIPAGLAVIDDKSALSNIPNYTFSNKEVVEDDMYSSLLKLLSKKQQMQHNVKTKTNKKVIKNKTVKRKQSKKKNTKK